MQLRFDRELNLEPLYRKSDAVPLCHCYSHPPAGGSSPKLGCIVYVLVVLVDLILQMHPSSFGESSYGL